MVPRIEICLSAHKGPQPTGRDMPSKTVTVGSSVGLHARPADIISKAAEQLDADVTISTPDGDPVDAGSGLFIMTLGADRDDEGEIEPGD